MPLKVGSHVIKKELGYVCPEWFDSWNTNDHTAAIQDAIEYAVSSSDISEIRLSQRTYNVSQIDLKSGVNIVGVNRSQTIINHTGNAEAIHNELSASIGTIRLADFQLNMNVNSTIGIDFGKVFNSVIERVTVVGNGSTGTGVKFDEGQTQSAYYNTCYDVHVHGYNGSEIALTNGFLLQNSGNSNRLNNCTVMKCMNGANIATDYTNHVVVFGSTFEHCTIGIKNEGDFNQFIANRFENCGKGVVHGVTSGDSMVIGSMTSNTPVAVEDNNTNGSNMEFNYGGTKTKFLNFSTGGGMRTNIDMRNYALQNTSEVTLSARTSQPVLVDGKIAMSDGVDGGWKPIIRGVEESITMPMVAIRGVYYALVPFQRGTTAQRPTANVMAGMQYFDTTLNKPIYRNANNNGWVDAMGTGV